LVFCIKIHPSGISEFNTFTEYRRAFELPQLHFVRRLPTPLKHPVRWEFPVYNCMAGMFLDQAACQLDEDI
jgi:hypothetical protein